MTEITHLHSSSRFDRSVTSLTHAANKYNEDADLVTYTEVEFEWREKAVRKANGDQFGMVSGDEGHANDSVICYKHDRFQKVYTEMYQASTVRVFRTTGQMRDPIHATIAVLKDKLTNKNIVVAVIHLASNVESDLARKSVSNRTRQWRDSLRKTKNRVNTLAKRFSAAARMVIADFNINFKRLWARALVKAIAPTYTNTWKNLKIAGGTHGRRIIDATLLRGKLKVRKSARLYQDDASSDHRPYIENLVWA